MHLRASVVGVNLRVCSVGMCACAQAGLRAHARHVGPDGVSTRTSILTFRWALAMEGKVHESEVSVRADHASERGVPFPAAWRSELNIGAAHPVVNVDALARAACRHAREELSLPEDAQLNCRPQIPHAHSCTHARSRLGSSCMSLCMCLLMCFYVHAFEPTWQARWIARRCFDLD